MKGRMTRPRTSSRRTEVIFALSLTPNSQLHQFPIQRARGRTAEGDSVRERKEGEGEGGRFGAVRRIYQTSWISFAANRRCAASATDARTDARSRSRAPCPMFLYRPWGRQRNEGAGSAWKSRSNEHGAWRWFLFTAPQLHVPVNSERRTNRGLVGLTGIWNNRILWMYRAKKGLDDLNLTGIMRADAMRCEPHIS